MPWEGVRCAQAAFPQSLYQRSLVYQSLQRRQEAWFDLEKVRDAAPRAAKQLHKRMGRSDKAVRCFLNALDIDPKDTDLIKAAFFDKFSRRNVSWPRCHVSGNNVIMHLVSFANFGSYFDLHMHRSHRPLSRLLSIPPRSGRLHQNAGPFANTQRTG
jgi:tetratricopeptide (TPR) repeat protein